jgi:hypothetical protein
VEVHYYAPFFLLFMNEKKGVEWEGALSPYCALLQTTLESKGVVNRERTKPIEQESYGMRHWWFILLVSWHRETAGSFNATCWLVVLCADHVALLSSKL